MKKHLWVLLVLATICGWGSYPALQYKSLQALGPDSIWIVLAIYAGAYAALMLTVSLAGLSIKDSPVAVNGAGIRSGLLFGFCSVLPAACFPLAMTFGPGPMVVPPISYSLIPVANIAICQFFDRRISRPRLPFYLSVFSLISGAAITFIHRPLMLAQNSGTKSAIWILFFAIMILCWGFFGLTQQSSIERNGGEPLWSLLFLGTAYLMAVFAGVTVLITGFWIKPGLIHVTWNLDGVAWAIISGFGAACGTICSVFAARLNRNPMLLSTIQFGSAPVVGVVLTYFAVRPHPDTSAAFWIGVAVVTVSVVLAVRFGPKPIKGK